MGRMCFRNAEKEDFARFRQFSIDCWASDVTTRIQCVQRGTLLDRWGIAISNSSTVEQSQAPTPPHNPALP